MYIHVNDDLSNDSSLDGLNYEIWIYLPNSSLLANNQYDWDMSPSTFIGPKTWLWRPSTLPHPRYQRDQRFWGISFLVWYQF